MAIVLPFHCGASLVDKWQVLYNKSFDSSSSSWYLWMCLAAFCCSIKMPRWQANFFSFPERKKQRWKISSIKFAWYILCRLLVLFILFVCFVCHGEISRTVRLPVACLVLPESPRRGGYTGFVLWRFDLWWESYEFSKFLWVIKIRKLLLFTFWLWQRHKAL